jgi:hypothetical protein
MLSTLLLLFFASWVNEKFIPVPGGAWLAYDYRFFSTISAIALMLSGMVLIRLVPVTIARFQEKAMFVLLACLAALAVFASFTHLIDVRKAYVRYDRQARRYMAKVFKHQQPVGIHLPHSRWHPDGTLVRLYTCLEEPDCNPEGTTFYTGYVSELYPVKLRSRVRLLSARESADWRKRLPNGPLIGYWKFDEPNRADICVDSSGNGNNGRPFGTTVVDGKFNRARAFNGIGDYIEIPPVNIPDAITVAAWVYSNRFGQNGFVVTKNPVNTQWGLLFEFGSLKWRGGGINATVACPAPANGSWHHLLAKQEGTTASLYLDGVRRASGSVLAIGNASSSINIGRYDSPSFFFFNGRIDDVRIYNRALSDPEIVELFGSDDPKPSPASPTP